MSMSTHVVGFRPADEKWHQMKTIWETCDAANVLIPPAVVDFFGGEAPGDRPGMEVDISKALTKWEDEPNGEQGFELRLSDLPDDVKIIRFFNAY